MTPEKAKATLAFLLMVSAAACCAMAPFAKFEDGMLSKTRPAGWLLRACRMQADGLAGHPEALSYPYNTCLWDGTIPRMGKYGAGWWRYEQTAYYTDGILRIGYALGDKTLIARSASSRTSPKPRRDATGSIGKQSF